MYLHKIATFGSPAKRYKVERKKIIVDDFGMEGIRCTVHDFYREMKYCTLRWNPCLLWLKRKVCLMVSELLSGSCSVSFVSGISKLMISGMCISSPV